MAFLGNNYHVQPGLRCCMTCKYYCHTIDHGCEDCQCGEDASIEDFSKLPDVDPTGVCDNYGPTRWGSYEAIIGKLVSPEVAELMAPPRDVVRGTLARYLLVGSVADVEMPQLRGADVDTQIEMMSTQLAHPVGVYDLDTGEKISIIV